MYRRNVRDVLPNKIIKILTGKVRHIITHLQKRRFSKKKKNSPFSIVLYLNPDESRFSGSSRLVTLVSLNSFQSAGIVPLSMVCLSVRCVS